MSDQYLQQLRSKDPAVRRAAIIALADSHDPNVADYLAHVAKTDPSIPLRTLAERAQRHALRKSWRSIDAENQQKSSSDNWYSDAERANTEINDVQRRARSQLFNAHGSSVNGDVKGALNYLVNAFELDPSLMHDKEAMRLTAELTGQPVDDAVNLLMSGVKKKERREGPTPFWTLIGYITLEAIVFFLLLTGMTYLILSGASRNVLSAPSATAEVRAQFARFSGSGLLVNAAAIGGASFVGYMIYFMIMFGVAMMMGGFGTIFDFANVMLRVNIGITVATLVVFGLTLAIKPVNPRAISGLFLGLGLISTCVIAYFASREMKFGFFRGLLTVFAPQVLACMILLLLVALNFGQAAAHFFSNLPS